MCMIHIKCVMTHSWGADMFLEELIHVRVTHHYYMAQNLFLRVVLHKRVIAQESWDCVAVVCCSGVCVLV